MYRRLTSDDLAEQGEPGADLEGAEVSLHDPPLGAGIRHRPDERLRRANCNGGKKQKITYALK